MDGSCLGYASVNSCGRRSVRTPIKIPSQPLSLAKSHRQTHPSAYLHIRFVLSDDRRFSSSSSDLAGRSSANFSGSSWSNDSDGLFSNNTTNSTTSPSSHHDSEPFFPETETATVRSRWSSRPESQVPYMFVTWVPLY